MIPSISNDAEEVGMALKYALTFKDMGFEAKAVLDGMVGVIEVGDSPETLGILPCRCSTARQMLRPGRHLLLNLC